MAATVTGTTFNFSKTVSQQTAVSTADKPVDTSIPTANVAGERTDWNTMKSVFGVQYAKKIIQSGVSTVISNLEGSQLSAQVNALQGAAGNIISLVGSFAANPVLGVVNLATQAISFAVKQNKIDRDKAWSDYDLSEYRANRGYSYAFNRSRSI